MAPRSRICKKPTPASAKPQRKHEQQQDARTARISAGIAEELKKEFPLFSEVDIREALEFEPLEKARRILSWAARQQRPHRALLCNYAREHSTGYSRPRAHRPDEVEEQRRFIAYCHYKNTQSIWTRGCGLSRRRLEDLARRFFAPSYRAQLERVSASQREHSEDEEPD